MQYTICLQNIKNIQKAAIKKKERKKQENEKSHEKWTQSAKKISSKNTTYFRYWITKLNSAEISFVNNFQGSTYFSSVKLWSHANFG